MENNNASKGITIGMGIPSVVVGTLIALKKVGMTTMSYSDILWFGAKVLLVCLAVAFCIWLVIFLIVSMFYNR
jgi:hypothetical protein